MPICLISCSGPLWGFVVVFMLFNIRGMACYGKIVAGNCYFYMLPLANCGNTEVVLM